MANENENLEIKKKAQEVSEEELNEVAGGGKTLTGRNIKNCTCSN